MSDFSGGFVLGFIVCLGLSGASVGVALWAALAETPDMIDEL